MSLDSVVIFIIYCNCFASKLVDIFNNVSISIIFVFFTVSIGICFLDDLIAIIIDIYCCTTVWIRFINNISHGIIAVVFYQTIAVSNCYNLIAIVGIAFPYTKSICFFDKKVLFIIFISHTFSVFTVFINQIAVAVIFIGFFRTIRRCFWCYIIIFIIGIFFTCSIWIALQCQIAFFIVLICCLLTFFICFTDHISSIIIAIAFRWSIRLCNFCYLIAVIKNILFCFLIIIGNTCRISFIVKRDLVSIGIRLWNDNSVILIGILCQSISIFVCNTFYLAIFIIAVLFTVSIGINKCCKLSVCVILILYICTIWQVDFADKMIIIVFKCYLFVSHINICNKSIFIIVDTWFKSRFRFNRCQNSIFIKDICNIFFIIFNRNIVTINIDSKTINKFRYIFSIFLFNF